ncbi:MAG: ABC transporter permease [Dehalococcoidia bacterium]
MGELFAGWRFIPQRVMSSWRLLSVTAVGVLVAAALLAAVPLYSTALSDLGLQFRLGRALDETRLNTIAVGNLFPGDARDIAKREAVNAIFDARVGWLGPERLVEERSGRLLLNFEPGGSEEIISGEAPPRAWNAFLFRLSDFERDVVVTEGRMPGPAGGPPEVVLPDGFQQHASIGETIYFDLAPFDDCEVIPGSTDPDVARQERRCRPSVFVSTTISATITGFVRPRDPDDQRWDIFSGTFAVPDEAFLPHVAASLAFDPFSGAANFPVVFALNGQGSMPLFTTAEQLFGPFAEMAAQLPMRYRVGLIANVRALTLGDVERGIEGTRLVRVDIGERLDLIPVMQWPVGQTLVKFRNTQTFQQIPLLIILLQVVGIVLYYVVVVSSMLVEREAEELSVLRSRGASTAQIVGLYLMEGALLAVIATAIAPWLAGQGVAALGYTPTFSAMTDGGALPVSVTPSAYLLSAAGATLAMFALMLPAFAVARRAIVDEKREQARPPGRSLIQRYYLDFAVVGLAAILLWQLDQRGTVFDPDAVGGWTADPLLLASPLIFTAAVAALVLRLYPPILRRTVSVLLTAGGTAVALGLRRTARAPGAYARLMLLLVMAISVGTFAASYGPTVDRSQTDRVRYATGVDLRGALEEQQAMRADERIEGLRAFPGVDDAALAFRGVVGTPARNNVQLLAIDPARSASMVWFRDDFAEQTLPEIMRALQSDVPSGGGILLAPETKELRVSLLATAKRVSSSLWARFRDSNGTYSTTRVTKIDFEGWTEFVIEIPGYARKPLSFAGFRVTEARGAAIPRKGALYFDAITAVFENGERQLLEDFERDSDRLGWTVHGNATSTETLEISSEQSASGNRAAKWSWPLGQASGLRYIVIDDPNSPLAVIVNPAAAASLGYQPEDTARFAREGTPLVSRIVMQNVVVPVRMVVVAEMFPTLLPATPFIVANVEHMRAIAALLDRRAFREPNEVWIATSGDLAEQQALLTELQAQGSPLRLVSGIRIREAELSVIRADPTLQASGSGILIAAFSAVLGLSMLGFVVSLVIGARARVVEFAVLRAVGASRFQVLRSMVLEWGVVLAIGAAIGVLLGRQLADVMLSFLNVTEDGFTVVPPFTVQTNWLMLGGGVAALAAVAGVGLLVAWASSVRTDTTMELRLTR